RAGRAGRHPTSPAPQEAQARGQPAARDRRRRPGRGSRRGARAGPRVGSAARAQEEEEPLQLPARRRQMITLLVRLALLLLGLSVVSCGAGRLVIGAARTALGVGADDPARRAQLLAGKIRGHLETSRAGEMYGPVLEQLGELVERRLPRLAETRD